MAIGMGANRYGKAGVRVATVRRDGPRHTFTDLTIDLHLEGDFDTVHTDGDNADVLPTDTMRGACYALAREDGITAIEDFGLRLTGYLLDTTTRARKATVTLAEQPWERITVDGQPHNHAFTRAAGGVRTATVDRERGGTVSVAAGVRDLQVLKTGGSAFASFLADRYTTLPPTDDRILATAVTAEWRYRHVEVGFGNLAAEIRRRLLDAFATHDDSQSVQHTLWTMGRAVLDAYPDVVDIRFSLPNRHHVLADLSPYGLDNRNEVFVVTDEPYGLIEGVVARDDT